MVSSISDWVLGYLWDKLNRADVYTGCKAVPWLLSHPEQNGRFSADDIFKRILN